MAEGPCGSEGQLLCEDDDFLFSDQALPIQVFGCYSAQPELAIEVSGARHPIYLSQCILRGPRGEHGASELDGQSVVLWRSAVSLARMWASPTLPMPLVAGRTIVELGAGLGLIAIALAGMGARKVIATEVPPAIHELERSISRNEGCLENGISLAGVVDIAELWWGDSTTAEKILSENGHIDVIVASDAIYSRNLRRELLSTISSLSTPGQTVCVFSYEERGDESKFFEVESREFGMEPIGDPSLQADDLGVEVRMLAAANRY
mgnify:CR=1 FL=1|mmetsp:Transcript_6879/g.20928  ORF Transcript_6879/g.20928 Transcript_6879/m.20928 type:complete len:264 (+) Transcript_6879:135-926(+)|eukprot:scaffold43054_cov36-Tisochrysis_lutea.AAC.1